MEYPKSASFPKWENYDLERLVNILNFTKGEEWLNWDFPQNIPDCGYDVTLYPTEMIPR